MCHCTSIKCNYFVNDFLCFRNVSAHCTEFSHWNRYSLRIICLGTATQRQREYFISELLFVQSAVSKLRCFSNVLHKTLFCQKFVKILFLTIKVQTTVLSKVFHLRASLLCRVQWAKYPICQKFCCNHHWDQRRKSFLAFKEQIIDLALCNKFGLRWIASNGRMKSRGCSK